MDLFITNGLAELTSPWAATIVYREVQDREGLVKNPQLSRVIEGHELSSIIVNNNALTIPTTVRSNCEVNCHAANIRPM